jgi:hypothetical protein
MVSPQKKKKKKKEAVSLLVQATVVSQAQRAAVVLAIAACTWPCAIDRLEFTELRCGSIDATVGNANFHKAGGLSAACSVCLEPCCDPLHGLLTCAVTDHTAGASSNTVCHQSKAASHTATLSSSRCKDYLFAVLQCWLACRLTQCIAYLTSTLARKEHQSAVACFQ